MLCFQDFPPALHPNLEASLPQLAPALLFWAGGTQQAAPSPILQAQLCPICIVCSTSSSPCTCSPGLCTQDIAASTPHQVSAPRTLHPEPCTQSLHTAASALHLDPAPQRLGPCTWQPGPCTQAPAPGTLHPTTSDSAPRPCTPTGCTPAPGTLHHRT